MELLEFGAVSGSGKNDNELELGRELNKFSHTSKLLRATN